jgi:hypothetical protein
MTLTKAARARLTQAALRADKRTKTDATIADGRRTIANDQAKTRFEVGERVRSLVDEQGLLAGVVYTVSKVETRSTFAGQFATYWLRLDGDRPLRVMNGHLLLVPAVLP